MFMRTFVTFESLVEGDVFFARGTVHCKCTTGVFRLPPNGIAGKNYNAFYLEKKEGTWALFDSPQLVQQYDDVIHGRQEEVLELQTLFAKR